MSSVLYCNWLQGEPCCPPGRTTLTVLEFPSGVVSLRPWTLSCPQAGPEEASRHPLQDLPCHRARAARRASKYHLPTLFYYIPAK